VSGASIATAPRLPWDLGLPMIGLAEAEIARIEWSQYAALMRPADAVRRAAARAAGARDLAEAEAACRRPVDEADPGLAARCVARAREGLWVVIHEAAEGSKLSAAAAPVDVVELLGEFAPAEVT